jgi:hypothetical protein
VQYLLLFLILFCVFGGVTCLVLCGIENALLVLIVIMPSLGNIDAFLCYSVDLFILAVAIIRYDYKLALNIVVKKLFVVGTCKP